MQLFLFVLSYLFSGIINSHQQKDPDSPPILTDSLDLPITSYITVTKFFAMRMIFFSAMMIGLILTSLVIFSCNTASPTNETASEPMDSSALIKKGEYLVLSHGCSDCHSPKEMGPQGPEIIAERNLGGYPADRPFTRAASVALANGNVVLAADLTWAEGPWGVSYAANITSDATGIGNWTEDQFKTALREGKSKGLKSGRPLLPPMPWPATAHLTDEDIRAIFYYLKSTPPVKNIVPAPLPPAAAQ